MINTVGRPRLIVFCQHRLFPASEIPPQSRVFIPFSIPPSGFLVHAACVSTQLSGGHEKCHLDLVQE